MLDYVAVYLQGSMVYSCDESHRLYLIRSLVRTSMIWLAKEWSEDLEQENKLTNEGCTYRSFSSTSCMCAFRSELSDVGVGGYSIDKSLPGRLILKIHGNQYKNMTLTCK